MLINTWVDNQGIIHIDCDPPDDTSEEECSKLHDSFRVLEKAFDALARYADTKSMAIHYRKNGDIVRAKCHENECDRIYNDEIPSYLKYW